ncbi:hypothetical protein RO3G_13750 [Rhizopus delemar RA 99-880]|uniref:Uncharacterized protein n=1 Tax=Rhizopus delemar (strain RA 99-880 / ATCC MYA-4621 / FGSC 9543 / NRRL 43880) TaxID=246409 RepID=I1CKQ9_RHIO9|nr:hypothetical protein RO3G_13750 [Rhizopus delemar RA 99-880]|eukprot:EIE89039.1 hypothetical protein RO3G_13750 [Rhizopus delemar RA 99-880]
MSQINLFFSFFLFLICYPRYTYGYYKFLGPFCICLCGTFLSLILKLFEILDIVF